MDGDDDGGVVRLIGPGETVVEAVVLAVAAATGRPPTSVDPGAPGVGDTLFDAVDPDALEALFRADDASGRFVFHWASCEIVVDGGTRVLVTPER